MTGDCRRFLRILSAIFAAVAFASSAAAEEAADPYAEALHYTFDQPRTAIMAIEAQIHAAKPAELPAIEGKLIAMLRSPDATRDCKDWVCRQLRQAGSEQSIDALAPLLADKDLATVARLALQSIPGPKVDAALRDAAPKLQGDLKAGVVLTIGARGDRQAVSLVAPLASDPNGVVAEAALYALGHIGGADALRAVQEAKVPESLKRYRLHVMLLCAERMATEGQPAEAAAVYQAVYGQSGDAVIKTAALRGIVLTDKAKAAPVLAAALRSQEPKLRAAAAKFLCELGGNEALGPVLADLASLPADVQVGILNMASDKAALAAVLASAKSSDGAVRAAALGALGRLGDAASVTLLLEAAAGDQGDAQAAARTSLQQLRAAEIDPALIAAAGQGAAAVRVEAIRALAARGAVTAVPMLLKAVDDADAAVAAESLAALAVLADSPALPPMVKLLADSKAEGRRAAAEEAVAAVCRRASDKEEAAAAVLAALPGAASEVRCSLLRVAARVSSAKSLEALRAAVGDADAAVKDAAIRGLAEWPDPAAIGDLLAIARTAQSQVHKVLALRGAVRLAALPSPRPAPETVKFLSDALSLAVRPEEKKLVLAALADVTHPAALDAAIGCLADKDLEVEAATAVVKIAKGVRLTDPAAAKAAVEKILEVCKAPAARQVAESTLVVLDTGANIAPQGTATSPDGLEKDGGAGGDQAAIDNNPDTYWDEEDGKDAYRLVVTFKQPEKIAALSIVGYEQHKFAPRDFEILCDGKVVKKVQDAQYDNNYLVLKLDEVTATTVELKITGYYGNSPAIRELGIYRPAPGK